MIPRRYIIEWKEHAPWPNDGQVEQDLVIEKAMLELFSDTFLQERLASVDRLLNYSTSESISFIM
jgi:hypothetical protein